jgi:4-diphosphocytidyl-2C-methyl-D-erythritol kinase
LLRALAAVRKPRDLASLPLNDLASSPLADELRALGAFRADVSGAGPAVYGLFDNHESGQAALDALQARGAAWVVPPAW